MGKFGHKISLWKLSTRHYPWNIIVTFHVPPCKLGFETLENPQLQGQISPHSRNLRSSGYLRKRPMCVLKWLRTSNQNRSKSTVHSGQFSENIFQKILKYLYLTSYSKTDSKSDKIVQCGNGDREWDDNAFREPLRKPPCGTCKKEQDGIELQHYLLRKPISIN